MTSRREAFALAGLLGLMAFVLWFGTSLADIRLIGFVRDDGELVAYGQALAAGLGYIDPSIPEHPPAARFPIGLPLLLAALYTAFPWETATAWVAPLEPAAALADFARAGTTHVLASPAFAGAPDALTTTLNPILRDWPEVMQPVWVSPSGRFAILKVDPNALRARLAALGGRLAP